MTNEQASERIAAAFEAGIAPWSRSARLHVTCGLPVHAATGKPFRGANIWLLELAAIDRHYRNRFWATATEWERLGAVVARGEGTPVIEDGDSVLPSGESVFYNLEQVEVRRGARLSGLDRFWLASLTFPDYDLAQRLLDATGAKVVPAERSYCVVCSDPSKDHIGMETLDALGGNADLWWSILFHELTHWVAEGFPRVGWRDSYNHCELIAEIGAATLTNYCGIRMRGEIQADCDLVRDWCSQIRENIGYLILACAVVEAVLGYVLNDGRLQVTA